MLLVNTMTLQYSLLDLKILDRVFTEELKRWNQLVMTSNNSQLISNYEWDMLIAQNLLTDIREHLEDQKEAKLTLSAAEIAFLIEALDHEIEASRKTLWCEKDLLPFIALRDRIKHKAEEVIGDRIRDLIHYDRSKN